jgi:hypothetical protein
VKKLLLIAFLAICCRDVIAQKIVERKNKITANVTERVQTVIEADKQVKQGTYQALFNKKTILASGKYVNDKKVGTWHYFDREGKLAQNYDYDNNALLYEAPEGNVSPLRYYIDYYITDKDTTTQPVRPGGRYFGYVPYFKLFKVPVGLGYEELDKFTVTFELLISPMGRLADIMVHIRRRGDNVDQMSYNLNIDLLPPDDKIFIPATFNKNPVASRINVTCNMDKFGVVDMR